MFHLVWFLLAFTSASKLYTYPDVSSIQLDTTKTDRDWFYILQNLESFPEYYVQIPALVHKYLEPYSFEHNTEHIFDAYMYHYFNYTEENLVKRLDDIYAMLNQQAMDYDPDQDPVFTNRKDTMIRIQQFGPLNLMDGAWLRFLTPPGPLQRTQADLFQIWMDEVGNGQVSMNHASLYQQLLLSTNFTVADVYTKEFAYDNRLIDSAFTIPAFELAISQYSSTFLPELLGMTLQLEWEVLALKPIAKLIERWGFSAAFYKLHVAIDNAVNGHGSVAKTMVILYMEDVKRNLGEVEAQRIWKRVWNGYATFGLCGTFAEDLKKYVAAQHDPHLKMVDIISKKAKYASRNHGVKQLNGHLLNDLFANPELMVSELANSYLVNANDTLSSPLLQLTKFNGPMFKVFTPDEVDTIKEWIGSLSGHSTPPAGSDPAIAMSQLIYALKPRQANIEHHKYVKLYGRYENQEVYETIEWWFNKRSIDVMETLKYPTNNLIVCGDSVNSVFYSKMTAPGTGMGNYWAPAERETLKNWIDADCPVPKATPQKRLTLLSPPSMYKDHLVGKILGMGAIH